MQQQLISLNEAEKLITSGNTLLIAGDEALLQKLPSGKWIGGSIPYFIAPNQGGLATKDKVFVTDISQLAASIQIKIYDQDSLGSVYTDAGNSGFSIIIIPALSPAHISFSLNGPTYQDFGSQPLIGWISGVFLEDLGKVTPKVFNGQTGKSSEEEALVMHVSLPAGKSIDVGIVNIFEQGDGDTLVFEADGFSCSEVLVNGKKENFADYVLKNKLDTKLPLVADYYGAMVNTSFQSVVPGKKVNFYAPVFKGVQYRHAKPISDYAEAFSAQLEQNNIAGANVSFSCNCILNYLYSELEGKKTGPFVGPITFGEVAYQLLNQTLVYLEVNG